MKDERLKELLLRAQQSASVSAINGETGSMVFFSILFAWLVTAPVMVLTIAVMIELGAHSAAPFFLVGLMLVLCCEFVMRTRDSRLSEHIGVSMLLGGGIMMTVITYIEESLLAAPLVAALAIPMALVTRTHWLRAPLGIIAALAAQSVVRDALDWRYVELLPVDYYGWLADAVIWLLVVKLLQMVQDSVPLSSTKVNLHALADGWIFGTCAGFAAWSGSTFLLAAQFSWRGYQAGTGPLEGMLSAVLALGAAAWLMWRWPMLRGWRWCGAAGAVGTLAYFSPGLGPMILCAVACLLHGKARLAVVAAICGAWILGGAYYQLSWSLLVKAQVFAGAGCTLLICAYAPARGDRPHSLLSRLNQPGRVFDVAPRTVRRYAGTCLVMVLLLANVLIVTREERIAHGTQVFARLAPRDPRSLLQGDYMALNPALNGMLEQHYRTTGDLRALLVTDKDKVVTDVQPWDGSAPATSNQHGVQLQSEHDTVVFGSDSWYFTEGDAHRWAAARYGEYRIDRNGRAWLVGLRGENLRPL